jgi:drug/metabolite transporter (DMT)-like permease
MTDLMLSPIGLLLAAVLSVTNVITDVARKKVADRHELVASTFWIRVFAALVFTVALLVRIFAGSPPVIHAPAALTAADIKDQSGLTGKLRQPTDPVSQLVSGRLSDKTRQALAVEAGAGSEALDGLVTDLNTIIKGGSIYDQQRFVGVNLSSQTQDLLAKNPQSEALAYLNRLLLEDAFPNEFAQHRNPALFGIASATVPPLTAYLVYLAIVVALIAAAQLLLMGALKASPMSLCIPFMAFTPVFLIGTGYVVLGELPSAVKRLGVGLIVIGSLVMHRKLFATGWTAPIKAVIREKGSRYVLLVAFILSITNPIEKQLILMSDTLTPAFAYCLGLCLFFAVLAWVRRAEVGVVMRKTAKWAIIAGVLDAAALLIQYVTVTYLAIVITISIKRAGIVLAILAGWLIFKERDIRDKLIAALVMVGGILIFYLPLTFGQALALAGVVLAGMVVALAVTHKAAAAEVAAMDTKKG